MLIGRDLLDHIYRIGNDSNYPQSVRNIMEWKKVCKLWCNTARGVLTDHRWWTDDDGGFNTTDRFRVFNQFATFPLRCTLHPKVDEWHMTCDGQGQWHPAGHPHHSVVATLYDLKVSKAIVDREECYAITHMVLKVDNVEGVFETVWGAMATKFRMARQELTGDFEWENGEWVNWRPRAKSEVDFVVLGVMLHNGWLVFGSLHEILLTIDGWKRPNGMPVISED